MLNKLLLTLGLVAVLYAILYVLFGGGCFGGLSGPGHYTLKEEILNPADTLKLIKYRREHGATVSSSIGLLITTKGDTSIKDQEAFFISYRDSIEVKWLSDTEILIKHPKELQVFKKDTINKGIKIRYEDLMIKKVFNSSKKPAIKCDEVEAVELNVGDWKWKEKHWAFQNESKLILNEHRQIASICNAVRISRIIKDRYRTHVYWLVVTIQIKEKGDQFVLQSDLNNNYWFDYKNDRYEGKQVAELLSKQLEDKMAVK